MFLNTSALIETVKICVILNVLRSHSHFFLLIKAERNDARHMGKNIVTQIGKAHKYFNIYLII